MSILLVALLNSYTYQTHYALRVSIQNKAHSGQNSRLSGQGVERIGKYWSRVESLSYEKELRSTLYHDECNMVMCSRYFKIPKKVKFEGSCHKKNIVGSLDARR